MIYDSFENVSRYFSVADGFEAAVTAMKSYSEGNFPLGRTDVDGDNVYLNLQSYSTVPATERELEVHEKYLDIFCVVQGKEIALVKPSEELQKITKEYDPEIDYYLAKQDDDVTPVVLNKDRFVVFFPGEAHASGIDLNGTQAVKKIVAKIRMK